jgi:hypothetical protein
MTDKREVDTANMKSNSGFRRRGNFSPFGQQQMRQVDEERRSASTHHKPVFLCFASYNLHHGP